MIAKAERIATLRAWSASLCDQKAVLEARLRALGDLLDAGEREVARHKRRIEDVLSEMLPHRIEREKLVEDMKRVDEALRAAATEMERMG